MLNNMVMLIMLIRHHIMMIGQQIKRKVVVFFYDERVFATNTTCMDHSRADRRLSLRNNILLAGLARCKLHALFHQTLRILIHNNTETFSTRQLQHML